MYLSLSEYLLFLSSIRKKLLAPVSPILPVYSPEASTCGEVKVTLPGEKLKLVSPANAQVSD